MTRGFGKGIWHRAGRLLPALWLAGCAAAFAQTPASPDVPASIPDLGTLLPRDLTPWGMFLNADEVVKAVMVGLAFASLVTWTVALAKGLEVVAARRRLRKGLRVLTQARSPRSAPLRRSSGCSAPCGAS